MGIENPAPQDAGHGNRQDLRQVIAGAEKARRRLPEAGADIVEQHRGDDQADDGRDHRHGHDEEQRVLQRGPEGGVGEEAFVIAEADEFRPADAAPAR